MCLLPMVFLLLGKRKLKIFLNDVALYVLAFLVQLFSVQKLTQTLNCCVVFLLHMVFFQDLVTKKTIGKIFFLQGLYQISRNFLNTKRSAIATFYSSLTSHTLWHQRLAYPSKNILI